jgi:hypothetical protein
VTLRKASQAAPLRATGRAILCRMDDDAIRAETKRLRAEVQRLRTVLLACYPYVSARTPAPILDALESELRRLPPRRRLATSRRVH